MRIAPRRRCTICQSYLDEDGVCVACEKLFAESLEAYREWAKQHPTNKIRIDLPKPKTPLPQYPLPFDKLDDEA